MDRKQFWLTLMASVLASVVATLLTLRVVLPIMALNSMLGHASAPTRGVYHVVVCFEDLHGLPAGAPVRLAGVKIGEVVEVGVDRFPDFPEKTAYARVAVDKRYRLYTGDKYEVAFGPPLGSPFLRITRGSPAGTTLRQEPVETVGGSGVWGMDEFWRYMRPLAEARSD